MTGLSAVTFLFNLYAEHIMRNASLDELQAGIKIMAENEEELTSLLMRVKEGSERASLKLNIKKAKILVSGPIISWQMGVGEEVVTDFLFLGSKIPEDGACSLKS